MPIQVNAINIPEMINLSITNTLQTFMTASGNLVSIGIKIDFVVSATSSPTDLVFTLVFEYV